MRVRDLVMDDDMVPMVNNSLVDPVVDNLVADLLVNDHTCEGQFMDLLGDEDKNNMTCFESNYDGGNI